MLSVVRRVGTVEEIVVVGAAAGRDVIADVIVDGNDVDMTQANVYSNPAIT